MARRFTSHDLPPMLDSARLGFLISVLSVVFSAVSKSFGTEGFRV